MSVSFQICQDTAMAKSPITRGQCLARLRTITKVPKKLDSSAGALGKAIFRNPGDDAPVFVLQDRVMIPGDADDGVSAMGIDVSYKAHHYQIVLHSTDGDWQAVKIISLPPMMYFNRMSRATATQMDRTQLLATTVADQVASRQVDNYANIPPNNYANIPG